MATERIVIEFVGDTTELEPAIDQLEALGQIDKKTAAAFKESNNALKERAKQSQAISQAAQAQGKSTTELTNKYAQLSKAIADANKTLLKGASSEVIKGFYEGITDALEEAGATALEAATIINNSTAEAGGPVVNLLTVLRNLKNELATVDPNSQRFQELSEQAAEVQNRIKGISLEVKNLASDTSQLDGLIQGVQGVAGAFQVAQGAAVLFGEENEEFEKTLLKLTALLNVTNGLQQIQTLLQKQSAATLFITNAQRNIQNLSLVVENGLQSKNVIVKGAATVATRALNAAMAANPAGILLVAIGALAGALLYFTSTADDATKSQAELNEEQIKANEILLAGIKARTAFNQSLDTSSQQNIKALETELELSKLSGASKLEQAKIEKQIADARVASAALQIELNARDLKGREKLVETEQLLLKAIADSKDLNVDDSGLKSRLAITQEQIALLDSVTNAYDDAIIAQAGAEKAITDAVTEESEARLAARKKEQDAIKAANLARLEEEKAAIQTRILLAKEGSAIQQKAQLELIDKEVEISLTQLDGVENVENQKNLIRKKGIAEAEKITRDGEARITKVFIDTEQKLIQAKQNLNDAALIGVEKNTQEEVDIKNRGLELQAQSQRLAAIQTFELSDQEVADSELLASELLLIDTNLTDAQKKNAQDLADFKKEQRDKEAAEAEALNDQLKQGAIQVLGAISQAYFTESKNRRDAETQAQIKSLNDAKSRELNNKRLTDEQKLAIEEKYQKQEAELKRRAWEADKNAKLLQAIINTALAVTAALAIGPPQGYVAAAISAALGAVEIATIASTQAPAFAKGVEYLQGPGTGTSDSIPAFLSKGERVMTAKTNAEYFPALSAIHNGYVSPDVANSLLGGFKYPNYTSDMSAPSTLNIDYDRFGKSVAANIDMDELTEAVVTNGQLQAGLLSQLNGNLKSSRKRSLRYR